MATDAFEMALIHRVFRRELAHAPDLISSVVAGDTKRSKVVSAHLCNVVSVLHHHHAAEDDQLWPTLRARLPLRVQDLARMQEEHTAIAESIAKVAAITTRWAATAGRWILTTKSAGTASAAAVSVHAPSMRYSS